MTELSPAAQAVLDAFGTYPLRAGNIGEDLIPALAAALRAAADQVVPDTECYTELHDNCCERSAKQERSDIRILLRAIAAELEGNHTSEND